MNSYFRILSSISLLAAVAGCCPSGCFVLSGPAFEALANPPPLREKWAKPETSVEQTQLDWKNCGGDIDGNFTPDHKDLERERRAEETNTSPASRRLYLELQRCMLRRGYRFIGTCYDNDISRALPACGAP